MAYHPKTKRNERYFPLIRHAFPTFMYAQYVYFIIPMQALSTNDSFLPMKQSKLLLFRSNILNINIHKFVTI